MGTTPGFHWLILPGVVERVFVPVLIHCSGSSNKPRAQLKSIEKDNNLKGALEYGKFLVTRKDGFLGGLWNSEYLTYTEHLLCHPWCCTHVVSTSPQ